MPVSSIRWVSQPALQQTKSDTATALISIRDPGGMHVGGSWAARLDLEFFDVEEDSMSRSERWLTAALGSRPEICEKLGNRFFARNGWPWRPCLEADALEITAFVRGLPGQATTLLVACDYGKSRSRAVAEWASGALGAPCEGDCSGTPNAGFKRLLAST